MESNRIKFNNKCIKAEKKIGQGAYSYVYYGIDVNTNITYAIKQVSANDDRYKKMLNNEISALKKLINCQNIITYFDNIVVLNNHYILLEYCPISLFSYIQKRNNVHLEDNKLLKLIYQITKAIDYMHTLQPPLIHRDLKIDNILINSNGYAKLCDFGSCTEETIDPSMLSHSEKINIEEKLQEATTNYYQSPEMLNLYLNHVINEKADIWALGCVFYFICSFEYPFEEGSRLAILNVNYKIIKSSSNMVNQHINPIIGHIFVVNPSKRPSSSQLIEELEHVSRIMQIVPNSPILDVQSVLEKKIFPISHDIFDQVISKAGNIIESLKETSQKIKNQINQNTKPRKPTKIPCELFTQKIGISSCPYSTKVAFKDPKKLSAEVLAEYLVYNYPKNFAIVDLINSDNYDAHTFLGRIVRFDFSLTQIPEMRRLLDIIKRLQKYIEEDPKRFLLIHCTDGGYLSHFIACLLLRYTGLFDKFQIFFETVIESKPHISIPYTHASFMRYGHYVERIANNPMAILLDSPIHLTMITISPVILCNRNKTGCCPYISIHSYGKMVYTSKSNIHHLKKYTIDDPCIQIVLNVAVYGDVQIIFHHAMVIDNKYYQKPIFSFQFHTGFLQSRSSVSFNGPELDINSASTLAALYKTQVKLDYVTGFEPVFPKSNLKESIVYPIPPIAYFGNTSDLEMFQHTFKRKPNADFAERRIQNLLNSKNLTPVSSSSSIYEAAGDNNITNDLIDTASMNSISSPRQEATKNSDDIFNIFENVTKSSSTNPFNTNELTSNPYTTMDDWINQSHNFTPGSKKMFSQPSNEDMISFDQSQSLFSKSKSTEAINTVSMEPLHVFNTINEWDPSPRVSTSSIPANNINQPNTFNNATKSVQSLGSFNTSLFDLTSSLSSMSTHVVSPPRRPLNSENPQTRIHKDPFSDIMPTEHQFGSPQSSAYSKPTLDETKQFQESKMNDNPSLKKVHIWARGKQKNIRALLSTFHLIIWCPDKWDVVNINSLNDYNTIKKLYRKACLLVHPDKLTDSTHIELARAIFQEITEAWKAFEATGGKVYR